MILGGDFFMNNIVSIEELRKKAVTEIEIPGFNTGGHITIKVKKPQIMRMASEGKIPNPLMGAAKKIAEGINGKNDTNIKDMAQIMELYCRSCMVTPTFDEMKDIITDEQIFYIFNWAIGDVEALISFRTDEENGPNNNDGKRV